MKLLHRDLALSSRVAQRFVREARLAAQLPPEHVARVLDAGQTEIETPYLVTELLAGRDLGEEMRRRGAMPACDAVDLVLDACQGLAGAHAVGLVHRDVKPGNLFLSDLRHGRPLLKVLDLGFPKLIDVESDPSTQHRTVRYATRAYMTPEQLLGDPADDPRTDQHALAALLYELLTGKRPYEAGSPGALILAITTAPPPRARRLRADLPEGLDAAIRRALAKQPAERFPDLAGFAAGIAPFGGLRAEDAAHRVAAMLGPPLSPGPRIAGQRGAPSLAGPHPGTVLGGGKYRVERVLGIGAMGVVLEAADLGRGGKVAVKLLRRDVTPSLETVERFGREARITAGLPPEHVARVFDVGQTELGELFLVMELLTGRDLDAELRSRGPLPVRDAVDLLLEACEGVAHAHAACLIHRDLKPANLFLASRGRGPRVVKVLDFGLAKSLEPEREVQRATQSATTFGTPAYMAPEQVRAAKYAEAPTEQHALAAILYEMLTGRPPYEAESVTELFVVISTKPPPQARRARADVPPGLDAAIRRALAKQPADRFPDLAVFAGIIAPFGGSHAENAARRIAAVLEPSARRAAAEAAAASRRRATAAGIAALAAVAAGALLVAGRALIGRPPPSPGESAEGPWQPDLDPTATGVVAVEARAPAPPVTATASRLAASASATGTTPPPARSAVLPARAPTGPKAAPRPPADAPSRAVKR
jgi:serine/threonine-protein kinase